MSVGNYYFNLLVNTLGNVVVQLRDMSKKSANQILLECSWHTFESLIELYWRKRKELLECSREILEFLIENNSNLKEELKK